MTTTIVSIIGHTVSLCSLLFILTLGIHDIISDIASFCKKGEPEEEKI